MPVQCTCLLCGRAFSRPPSNPGRYCSRACSTTAKNRAHYGDSVARFWSYVDKTHGCWLWIGPAFNHGYGLFSQNGRSRTAHRVSYEMAFGPIADGLCVLHRCDTPLCVRPDHLWLGTRADNNADKDAKGRAVKVRGEAHHEAKLTDTAVRAIRRRLAAGESMPTIARDYGVTPGAIHHVKSGRAWTHVT